MTPLLERAEELVDHLFEKNTKFSGAMEGASLFNALKPSEEEAVRRFREETDALKVVYEELVRTEPEDLEGHRLLAYFDGTMFTNESVLKYRERQILREPVNPQAGQE